MSLLTFLCPNIGAFILRIVPNTFPMVLVRRIDLSIIQDLFYFGDYLGYSCDHNNVNLI